MAQIKKLDNVPKPWDSWLTYTRGWRENWHNPRKAICQSNQKWKCLNSLTQSFRIQELSLDTFMSTCNRQGIQCALFIPAIDGKHLNITHRGPVASQKWNNGQPLKRAGKIYIGQFRIMINRYRSIYVCVSCMCEGWTLLWSAAMNTRTCVYMYVCLSMQGASLDGFRGTGCLSGGELEWRSRLRMKLTFHSNLFCLIDFFQPCVCITYLKNETWKECLGLFMLYLTKSSQ